MRPPISLFAERSPLPQEAPYRGLRWIFIGDQGLRAGWSLLVFLLLCNPLGVGILNILIFAAMFHFGLIGKTEEFSPRPMFFAEAGGLLALIVAIELVGLIEGRRIFAYNLTGPKRPQHFFFGLAAGFSRTFRAGWGAGGRRLVAPRPRCALGDFHLSLLFIVGLCFSRGGIF